LFHLRWILNFHGDEDSSPGHNPEDQDVSVQITLISTKKKGTSPHKD
jgi:hypothetical protein